MAPVFPAEMKASDSPLAWRESPTTSEESRFAADGGERLVAHADDVARGDDVHPRAVDVRIELELRLDDVGPADQLHPERGRKVAERQAETFDLDPGSVIAPHRIQRDPDHAQSSPTSIRFFPP